MPGEGGSRKGRKLGIATKTNKSLFLSTAFARKVPNHIQATPMSGRLLRGGEPSPRDLPPCIAPSPHHTSLPEGTHNLE